MASATVAALICLIKLGDPLSWGPQVTVSITGLPMAELEEPFTPCLLDLLVTVSLLVCGLIWDSGSPGSGR